MRWGTLSIGLLGLTACEGDGIFIPATSQTTTGASGSGGGGAAGATSSASATGGTGGSGASASTGTGGSAVDVAPLECVSSCCDGELLQGLSSNKDECKINGGFDCKDKGGPLQITYESSLIWAFDGACPSMRPCELNCCNGVVQPTAQEQFDGALCAQFAKQDPACNAQGGTARVVFDGDTVFQDLGCAGNCSVSCCDGTVAFGDEPSSQQCSLWAASACGAAQGGPRTVAYDGVLSWTAAGQCPSLRTCKLTCMDGLASSTAQYQASVCIYLSVNGGTCEGHGGPAGVEFDGQKVWP